MMQLDNVRAMPVYTVILLDRIEKWGHSSIARNPSAPNAKIIFEILWGILEGQVIIWEDLNNPSQDFKKSFCLGFLWIPSNAESQN